MNDNFEGKRVLVTQSADYMGPASIEAFQERGATVFADEQVLTEPGLAEQLIKEHSPIDVLIANLAAPTEYGRDVVEIDDDGWQQMFEIMVHPLHRLTRAVLPSMYERKQGKIVVFGSATGLKAIEKMAAYSSARAAQIGYVRCAGHEAAKHNVQINLIAQIFVESTIYFPPEFVETAEFKTIFANAPMERLATARESAELAIFLASTRSDFFVGQAIPFSGGWVH